MHIFALSITKIVNLKTDFFLMFYESQRVGNEM